MLIVFRDTFFQKTLYTLYHRSYGYIVKCGVICHTYIFIINSISEERLKIYKHSDYLNNQNQNAINPRPHRSRFLATGPVDRG